jgi:hypothetical protein
VTSGAKVIVLLLGAVGAVALFAVVAFLLTDERGVRCVEGELQDNVIAPDGTIYPRIESFATLAEAEAFVCRRLPRPRRLDGLELSLVRVARERNLGDTIEGEGGVFMEYEYGLAAEPATLRLGVNFPPPNTLPEGSGEALSVRGEEGRIAEGSLQDGVDTAFVVWIKDGFYFNAHARYSPDFDREALLRILESVR